MGVKPGHQPAMTVNGKQITPIKLVKLGMVYYFFLTNIYKVYTLQMLKVWYVARLVFATAIRYMSNRSTGHNRSSSIGINANHENHPALESDGIFIQGGAPGRERVKSW